VTAAMTRRSHRLWGPARLVTAAPAHEGPVYVAEDDALYYTTVPQRGADGAPVVRVERIRFTSGDRQPEVVVEDANAANGMCPAPGGGLLVCEQGNHRRIARITHLDTRTGRRETVITEADGAPLSSPNDIVASADGTIWFTDPSYGFLQGFRPRPQIADGVRQGSMSAGPAVTVSTAYDKPNGIALSPDGRELLVGDSGANHELGSCDPRRPHDVWRHPLSVAGRPGADHVARHGRAGPGERPFGDGDRGRGDRCGAVRGTGVPAQQDAGGGTEHAGVQRHLRGDKAGERVARRPQPGPEAAGDQVACLGDGGP